ncbi:hypothetical protein LC607_06035 [Nostoc sp. CHAB 5824]|nr:hypothetical protein [Nostoc sp. CHAB 5824]
MEKGGTFPIGLGITSNIDISCAACHVPFSNKGERLLGVPNGEIATPLLVALAPNSAAGFSRLKFNPLDQQYKGNGKIILDSKGNKVELPDPEKFEKAFDDAVLDVPLVILRVHQIVSTILLKFPVCSHFAKKTLYAQRNQELLALLRLKVIETRRCDLNND